MSLLGRVRALLAGLWAGVLLSVGGVAAPALFATLDRASAGLAASRIFTVEAYLSLAFGALLLVLERVRVRRPPEAETQAAPRQFSRVFGLALLALACTVAGHFAIQPLIVAAKAGQPGAWSFASLHAASTLLFGIKAIAVLGLAWVCTRGLTPPRPLSPGPSS